MVTEDTTGRFLAALSAEKLKAQERRGSLITKKLAWVTGLFALGAIKLPMPVESHVLLYFVPVVSLVYDLYVLGENYGIKRMGSFIRQHLAETREAEWEAWLPTRRDQYSWYALPISTGIILVACGTMLLLGSADLIWLSIWFGILGIVTVALYCRSARAVRTLDINGNQEDMQDQSKVSNKDANKQEKAVPGYVDVEELKQQLEKAVKDMDKDLRLKMFETEWEDHFQTRSQTWKALQISALLTVAIIGIQWQVSNPLIGAFSSLLLIGISLFGMQITKRHRNVVEITKFSIIRAIEEELEFKCESLRLPDRVELLHMFALSKANTSLFLLRMQGIIFLIGVTMLGYAIYEIVTDLPSSMP